MTGTARRDLLLFAGALTIRLAHVVIVRPGPLFRYLLIDSEFYDGVGRRLAEGGGFPDGVFFMNVLYGAFLGAVYSVFGAADGGRLAALVLQALLGAAACVLTARTADAMGRPRDGVWAGAVLAVYGPAIFYDGALITPSLLLFLTTAAVLVAVRTAEAPGGRAGAVLGGLGGLLVLGRANHALLVPVLLGPWLLRGRGGRVAAGIAVAVCVLVVAPVTVRNFRESGELVPVSSNGGMALWAGNHETATGIYSEPEFLTNPVPEHEAEDYRAEASRRSGRDLTLAESGRFWVRETLRAWTDDSGRTLRLGARKLRIWLNATESQTNLSYYFAQDFSPVLAVFRVHLGWILPFALLGLAFDARRFPVVAAPIAVSLLTCLAFYVSSEYRHPVVPGLILFAVGGARRIVGSARSTPTFALGAGVVALFVVVNYQDPFLARLESRRVDYLNFGTLAGMAGELHEAERFLEQSIAIDPAWPPNRRKLAEILQRRGEARRAAEQTLIADRLEGRRPDDLSTRVAAANRLFEEKRFAEALAVFRELIEAGEEPVAGSLNNAGLCEMRLGRAAAAESLFHAAIAHDSTYASPVIHLGRLALARGDSAAAVGWAEHALEIAPADGRASRLRERASSP
jgi:Tfp pilus assembly protein PilF